MATVLPAISAQGCSDAGICTLPAFRPKKGNALSDNMHELKAGVGFGIGELSVAAIDPFIGYNLSIKKYRLETRLNYGIRTGNGWTVSDFGDAYVLNSYQPTDKFSISAGFKFPLEFNKQPNINDSLPMAYQPSLGTLDLITGLSLQMSKWQIALALQLPLKTLHENAFSPETLPNDVVLNEFPDTRSFDRKADILLRVSRQISPNDKFSFSPGVLAIYHVGDDQYKTSSGEFAEIEGSAGLTINASVFLDYKVKENGIFSANLGFPLLVRESRPDGLTRSFVIGIDYTFSF